MRFSLCLLLLISAALPAMAQEKATADTVLAASKAAYAGSCFALSDDAIAAGAPSATPVSYDVTVPGEDGMEPQTYVVWEVLCDLAAYNALNVYWVENAYAELKPLSFPMPVITAELERPDDPESPVKSVAITGWTSVEKLVNPAFDPATRTFSHYGKYRGIGDAFDAGTWVLTGDATEIATFEVDASYDGEITPVTVYPAP